MIKDKHEIADITRNIFELIGNLEKGCLASTIHIFKAHLKFPLRVNNTPRYLNWRTNSISCPLMRNFGLYNLLPLLKNITLVLL
jgi:hypothetical protein